MKRVRRRTRDRVANDPMPQIAEIKTTKRGVNPDILARSRSKPAVENAFVLPTFPASALPPGATKTKHPLAMDTQLIEVNAWASQSLYAGAFNNGATFLGYPYLSQLAQIPEYRKITETIAMHMTRKFITLQAAGEAGEGDRSKTDKIKALTDDLENFGVRDVFRKAAEVDGYFGRAHLYIDLGYADRTELKMPIGDGRNALSRMKVTMGSLKGFKIIEPVWTYPGNYNSNNPMTMDWYNPQTWFVMQQEIHVSRCIRMVGREVPDLLKPAYSFGGLSLSQMAKPYVDNWLRTRQSVADLIWSFSVSGVSTDLQTLMQADGGALFDRAELFNNLRNNRGMMLLNKDSEEFFQVNTPLGTLDKLQAQAQEHMASVSSIPLVFLLGITPSGLNASSEGEIRAFYDFIHAYQMKFFTDPLKRVIDFIQLSRYGEIDPEITFIYEPLWSSTEKEQAEIDKTRAETDDLRINDGVISPLEARKRVANAPDTPYAGLDVTVLPVPPGGGGEEDPFGGEDPNDPDGGPEDPNAPPDENPDHRSAGEDEDIPFAQDSSFKEGDHPRGQPENKGQFGAGGGGESGSKPKVVAHYGSYAVEHNGEHVKNKLGNTKYFNSPEAAEKFASTYTGEPEAPKEKKPKEKKQPGMPMPAPSGFKEIETNKDFTDIVNASSERGNMTDEDKQVLMHYTSPAYAPLNKALRTGKELSPDAQAIVDKLDKAISDSVVPVDLTLFRGLRGKKVREMMDNLLPGDTLTDKGFVSTSLGKHVAQGQSESGQRTTMVIRAPKGSNAAFPGEHSYNTKADNEGNKIDDALEAILPRGSQFKFLGKKGATYEFEYVHNKGAQDEGWTESKHPRGQPGNAGQFGPGGGGSSGSGALALAKKVTSIVNAKAGISGKYRQSISNLLKDPGVSSESKNALKKKLIESYEAKAIQLQNKNDPKWKAVAEKAKKLWEALPQSVPIKTALKESPEILQKLDTPTEAKPSPEEIKKAMKATTVPGSSPSVAAFNKKWGGFAPIDEADATQKIKDYKKMIEEGKVEIKAEQEKAQAAQKEKAQKEAEAMAAMMNDPETVKHYEVLKKITGGLSPQRKKDLDSLITKAGLADTGFNAVDCALVQAYTGSDYGPVNRQLREGSLTKEQFGYAKSLQNALKKLPDFKGIVKRGTNLPADVFKQYKPGFVVPERAFTSTGEGYKFSGSHTYEIESVSGKDVRKISSQGEGEQEVIFPAGSNFEVISVTGKHIKMRQVENI